MTAEKCHIRRWLASGFPVCCIVWSIVVWSPLIRYAVRDRGLWQQVTRLDGTTYVSRFKNSKWVVLYWRWMGKAHRDALQQTTLARIECPLCVLKAKRA